MGYVRLGRTMLLPPHGIKVPDQPRITPPSFDIGDVLGTVIPPQSARTAKDAEPAFGADARSGEDENACHWPIVGGWRALK
jgi:hypothetical protein